MRRQIDTDELRRLVEEENATASQAGAALGITKNAAIGRARRLGLTWTRSPEPKHETTPHAGMSFPPPGCCLYGHGDPGDADFRWCGSPVLQGESWCLEHYRMVFLPPKPVEMARVA